MADFKQRLLRKKRIRKRVEGTTARPRLSVYKSLQHMYAQIIDDSTGKTIASASSLSKELKSVAGEKKKIAQEVGKLLASKAKNANVTHVVFDRNGFPYHGRIAAIADAAREGGLQF